MDMLLLGITVVSLGVALVMSVTAWRLTRDERRRAAARIAALSVAASAASSEGFGQAHNAGSREPGVGSPESPATFPTPAVTYSPAFLDTRALPYGTGRQHWLAIAAAVLLLGLGAGLVWKMSAPRGSTAVAMGPNMPLELVSLRHDRQNATLAVSGLVRNPLTGRPVERVSAVVLLFDHRGTLVTSATALVDFLKLGVGDESPFVVSLDAPPTVARYRVSFRTDEGVVSHVDRRGAPALATEAEQAVNVRLK